MPSGGRKVVSTVLVGGEFKRNDRRRTLAINKPKAPPSANPIPPARTDFATHDSMPFCICKIKTLSARVVGHSNCAASRTGATIGVLPHGRRPFHLHL